MLAVPPKSMLIHCGSLNTLDQRVLVRPSTAAAGALPPSCDDAATVLYAEIGVPPAGGGSVGPPPPVVPKTRNSQSE